MDFISRSIGWIEAICGPMFSGKSEELIRRLRRAMIARKRVQVFKPSLDTRFSEDEIVSHADVRMKSEVVSDAAEILSRLDSTKHAAGVASSPASRHRKCSNSSGLNGRRKPTAGWKSSLNPQ